MTRSAGGEVVIVNGQETPLDGEASLRYPDLQAFADAVLQQEEWRKRAFA